MNRQRLKADLKRHEGFRATAYQDSVGVWTVGYGRNLEAVGLTEYEADILLENDIQRAEGIARSIFAEDWHALDPVRQEVLVNMAFNLGWKLRFFALMRRAVHAREWTEAARQMLDSRWAVQVGKRAQELADRMRTGEIVQRD